MLQAAPPMPHPPPSAPAAAPVTAAVEPLADPVEPIGDEVLRNVRLFGAALAETFESRLGELTTRFAADVLGRELLLAPADLGAIAARLIAQSAGDEPLRLRLAPADAARISSVLTVIADPDLSPGDAILECRNGSIDARLAIRLATVVACFAR
jgi:flagellar biosynthesis/type III secretory pathway protein FliH